jgi:hypothetical protein
MAAVELVGADTCLAGYTNDPSVLVPVGIDMEMSEQDIHAIVAPPGNASRPARVVMTARQAILRSLPRPYQTAGSANLAAELDVAVLRPRSRPSVGPGMSPGPRSTSSASCSTLRWPRGAVLQGVDRATTPTSASVRPCAALAGDVSSNDAPRGQVVQGQAGVRDWYASWATAVPDAVGGATVVCASGDAVTIECCSGAQRAPLRR